MVDKEKLRHDFRHLRKSFVLSSEKEQLDRNLAKQIEILLSRVLRGKVWGMYSAYGSEADPQYVQCEGVTWVYPVVSGKELEFHRDQDRWTKNEFKILEPAKNKEKTPLELIEGVLVPGVVFNKNGHRLGSGKGFFDRTLAKYRGLKVGVCYSIQLINDPLPSQSHDVKMDYIVTEKEIIEVK